MIMVYSILVLGLMGLFAGLILSYLSNKFAVKKDSKVIEIEKALPGFNCGACGYPGCHPYAEAVSKGEAEVNLCKPGAAKVAEEIGDIMGKEASASEKMAAQRYCDGGTSVTVAKFEYNGISTCRAASVVQGGFKQCSYACLGLGDCERVCPVDCITMNEDNLPIIDKETCIGCEKCVIECPTGILKMAPAKSIVHVRCSSLDKGPAVIKSCKVGCIACTKCEKVCPCDAIHVIDNLAVIDYSKCTHCQKCVEVCPRDIIKVEAEA